MPGAITREPGGIDLEEEARLADSVGLALLAVLDPDVVIRADRVAVSRGASGEVRGAPAVARQLAGRAGFARAVLVNGAVGLVVAPRGRLVLLLRLTIRQGKIVAIDAVADPAHLHQVRLAVLDD